MLRALLVGVALGVVSEIVANAAGLWLYRKTISPLINSLLMFGVVMGGVSLLQPTIGYGGVFALGLAIGYAYEWANFLWLDWWYFLEDRFLVFRGRQACAVSIAFIWAAVPIIIHALATMPAL